MYQCKDCNEWFEEPKKETFAFEDYYGVSTLFQSRTLTIRSVCPACKSSNIEELEKCDVCEEYTSELIDTEECINGGIGYVCPQCFEDNECREF